MPDNNDDIYKYQPLWENWYIDMPIGRGSFGSVYKISREDMGHKYTSAVKIISIPSDEQYREAEASFGGDEASLSVYFEDIVHNIVNEINIIYSLKGNSNIVGYEDHKVIKKDDRIGWDVLIRMEYVTALKKYIASHQMTRREIIQLGIDICTALQLCSKKGIIHRDIKDDNIFVNQDGVFKLGDFGISRELSKSGRAASMRGTPLYMAPEVYRGDKYDAAVDIYSLGIVMYKLLNHGRMPFMPPYPQTIRFKDSEEALEKRMSGEQLPIPDQAGEALGNMIIKACAFKAEDRFGSSTEMKREMERVLGSLPDMLLDEPITMLNVKSNESVQTSESAVTNKTEGKGATVSIFGAGAAAVTTGAGVVEIPTAQGKELDSTVSIFGGGSAQPMPETAGSNPSTADSIETEQTQSDLNRTQSVFGDNRIEAPFPDDTDVPDDQQETAAAKHKKSKKALIAAIVFIVVSIIVISIIATKTPYATIVNTPTIVNTYGNTVGNIANGGFVAQQGDWIYYLNFSSDALYKIKTDGTGRKKLNSEVPRYINIVGDWIYYSNHGDRDSIYKIDTDGTERTKLNSDDSEYINVVGDWVYYNNVSDDYALYKIKTDGTGRTKLSSDNLSTLNVVGDWIYYGNNSDGGTLYKIKTDGTGRTKLGSDASYRINVVGDWVYYINFSDDYALYKIKTDGTGRTKLSSDNFNYINVVGDWIYYENDSDNNALYKIKTNGTGRTKLNSYMSEYINVIGDWVYYANDSDGGTLYKIRTDGTQRQKVQ